MRKQQGNWLSYRAASTTTVNHATIGNHSAVKTTNLFLQCCVSVPLPTWRGLLSKISSCQQVKYLTIKTIVLAKKTDTDSEMPLPTYHTLNLSPLIQKL